MLAHDTIQDSEEQQEIQSSVLKTLSETVKYQ